MARGPSRMFVTAFAPHLTVLFLAALFLLGGSVSAAPNPLPAAAGEDAPRVTSTVLVGLGLLVGVWIEWWAWRRRWPGT